MTIRYGTITTSIRILTPLVNGPSSAVMLVRRLHVLSFLEFSLMIQCVSRKMK